jgi:thiol:disulfide interchange protein DsbD
MQTTPIKQLPDHCATRSPRRGGNCSREFYPRTLLAIFVVAAIVGGHALVAIAQEVALQTAASVLQPQAYVSIDPVPRDHAFQIAVVAKVMPGFHINAHVPSEDYLIPTKITAELPPGVSLVETTYPRGVMRKFAFSSTQLRVYEDSFTLLMKLRTTSGAPLGPQKIAFTISYQACNEEACLPPTKVPVIAEFAVAELDTPVHPINPEVFAPATPARPPAKH